MKRLMKDEFHDVYGWAEPTTKFFGDWKVVYTSQKAAHIYNEKGEWVDTANPLDIPRLVKKYKRQRKA